MLQGSLIHLPPQHVQTHTWQPITIDQLSATCDENLRNKLLVHAGLTSSQQLLDRQNSNAAAGPSKSSSRPLGRQRTSINYSWLAGNRKPDVKLAGTVHKGSKKGSHKQSPAPQTDVRKDQAALAVAAAIAAGESACLAFMLLCLLRNTTPEEFVEYLLRRHCPCAFDCSSQGRRLFLGTESPGKMHSSANSNFSSAFCLYLAVFPVRYLLLMHVCFDLH